MSLFHSFFSIKHIAFILLILCHLQHYHPSHSSRSLILSKFGFVFKSFAFGIIEGHESSFTCLNSNELQTNNKSFTFWQCDTNELLHQNIVLPYVPSSIAFNDFIILSDFTLRNWKPQTLHKASFLSNTTVLQRISLLLFDRIKHLTQTVSDMQRTISRHEAEIVNLKSQLANKHRLYIRYIKNTRDWSLNKLSSKIGDKLGSATNRLRTIKITEPNIQPIIWLITFTNDNGTEFYEQWQTSDPNKKVERTLVVAVHQKNSNKWVSSCCPAQWLSNKINKGHILENTNIHQETCRLDEPQISFIISSGTLTIHSGVRWQMPNQNYWQTLQ